MKEIKVAVAGNPNSGKSTLINAIAGTHLQVGNWPGVTVEKKTATFKFDELTINLVDLPGTYSLSPYTQEEVIARDFLVKEKPDLIIDVVDSTNLERNLYLAIQLLEIGIPVVLALNIYDEAKKKGYEIDIEKLEQLLGVKAIPTVATKKEGINELLQVIKGYAEGIYPKIPKKLSYGDVEDSLKIVEDGLKISNPELLNKYPSRWLTIKLFEGDELVLKEAGLKGDEDFLQQARLKFLRPDETIESIIADIRYGIAHGVTKEVLTKREKRYIDLTDKIDKILLNRVLGIPIFFIAMWLVFKIAFDFSSPFSDWLGNLISGPVTKWTAVLLNSIGSPDWFVSLVTDGVIAGVGAVIGFIPLIGIVMLMLTFLEGSGYMARVAFVMDRLMHSIGLHGKSFIPLVLGFGCNVASIYGTRVLETERDRKLTAMLAPLMSCGARLPIYILFVGAFFAKNGPTVIWSLYTLGIFMAILLGFVLKKTLFKGPVPLFLMELPPYRIPTLRDLRIFTWQKLKHFVVKAGTFIFATSVIMWFLLNVPYGVEKENSALAKIGKTISPVFEPCGFGTWEASSSLITGLIAKEVVISTMAEIYVPKKEEGKKEESMDFLNDLQETAVSFVDAVKDAFVNLFSFSIKKLSVEEEEEQAPLKGKLQEVFTPLSAYAFLAFVLLYWPCIVTIFAMKQEFGWKILAPALPIYTIMPWLVAFLIYQGGRLLGF